MFPPARKMTVTSPISTQEKMKLIPTPLRRADILLVPMKAETEVELRPDVNRVKFGLSVDADTEPERCNVKKRAAKGVNLYSLNPGRRLTRRASFLPYSRCSLVLSVRRACRIPACRRAGPGSWMPVPEQPCSKEWYSQSTCEETVAAMTTYALKMRVEMLEILNKS